MVRGLSTTKLRNVSSVTLMPVAIKWTRDFKLRDGRLAIDVNYAGPHIMIVLVPENPGSPPLISDALEEHP